MSKWAGFFLVITIPVALCSYQLGRGSRDSTALPASDQSPNNATVSSRIAAPSAGYIGFMPEIINLGDQPWQAEVPFTTSLVNGSDKPVEIAVVKRSCGCTSLNTAEYAGRIVGPNELVDFSGAIHVGERAGPRSESISVMLTSGAVHVVNIETSVFATYDWTPRELDFEEVELDQDAGVPSSAVHFFSDTARIVGRPEPDAPWLVASLIENEHGATQIAVGLRKDRLLHDRNFGRLRITTDDPTRPTLWIPVRATGVSELRPVPAHVFLRRGETRTVRFLTRRGDGAHLQSVQALDGSVSVVVAATGDAAEVSAAPDNVVPHPVVVSIEDNRGICSRFWVTVLDD